jgi:hypothetical protein
LFLLPGLLLFLGGCAIGVVDGRGGFHGAVIGAPYPGYYSGGYYSGPSHGYRAYPPPPGRYHYRPYYR